MNVLGRVVQPPCHIHPSPLVSRLPATYRKELGVPEPDEDGSQPPPVKELGGQFVAGLAMAAVLAWIVGESSAGHGTKVGLAAGILVAAVLGQFYLFEGKSVRHLLINVGYIVIGLTAAGAIAGAFKGS